VFKREKAPQKFHAGDRVVCRSGQGKGVVVGDIFWDGYQRFFVVFDGDAKATECLSEYMERV
jgi:hypothetical protein